MVIEFPTERVRPAPASTFDLPERKPLRFPTSRAKRVRRGMVVVEVAELESVKKLIAVNASNPSEE